MIDQREALIQYDLTENPRAIVVEFVSHKIADPDHARQLNQQLHLLVRPDLPNRYVLDFAGVSNFTSTAFGALVEFIVDVRNQGGRVVICNMDEFVRFGASILHLPDLAPIADSRRSAVAAIASEEIPWSESTPAV